jgi:hypothetical protein
MNLELNILILSRASFSSLPGVFVPESFCLFPGLVSAANALLKTKINKPPQTFQKVIRSLTNLNKAKQTSKKHRQTNLVRKPRPCSADIPVCRDADFPVCFPKARRPRSMLEPPVLTSTRWHIKKTPPPVSLSKGPISLLRASKENK